MEQEELIIYYEKITEFKSHISIKISIRKKKKKETTKNCLSIKKKSEIKINIHRKCITLQN